MTRPEHAKARRDEIVRNLAAVIAIAKDGGPLPDGYGFQIKPLHDIARDLDDFVLFASLWEDHCRDNGLNPRTGGPLVSALAKTPGEPE